MENWKCRTMLVLAAAVVATLGAPGAARAGVNSNITITPYACGETSANVIHSCSQNDESMVGNHLITAFADGRGEAGYVVRPNRSVGVGNVGAYTSIKLAVSAADAASYADVLIELVTSRSDVFLGPGPSRTRFIPFTSLRYSEVSTCHGDFRVATLDLGPGVTGIDEMRVSVVSKFTPRSYTFGKVSFTNNKLSPVFEAEPGTLNMETIFCP